MIVSKEDTKKVARRLGILINGIWTRSGSLVEPLDSEKAISDMECAIMNLLPHDANSVEQHKKIRQKIETIAGIALGSRAYQNKFM